MELPGLQSLPQAGDEIYCNINAISSEIPSKIYHCYLKQYQSWQQNILKAKEIKVDYFPPTATLRV